jgi:tetratricopeptide (TPR) repeat protein
MIDKANSDDMAKLEKFDELFVGNPIDIEKNLKELLPQAAALKDPSIFLQILSQIALAQAMQKNFDDAHKTLNEAEKLLSTNEHLAQVRILLERGRIFMQAGSYEKARPFFFQSYELSKLHHFDYHTANAAHMIAIIAQTPEDKMNWNVLAIELAESSTSIDARAWRGSLYNNLGQAYIEAKQYDNAFNALKKCLDFRIEEGYAPNIRVAKWAIARTLRLLNQHDEALNILLPLMEEYDSMAKQDKLDIPKELLPSVRGLVYEELAEVYEHKAMKFAGLCYQDLLNDEWFKKLEPERLERMRKLASF